MELDLDILNPARITLDRTDGKILTELQHDAALPIAVLANRVAL
jgi:DNA-binding Lrp family transcriptional regulator